MLLLISMLFMCMLFMCVPLMCMLPAFAAETPPVNVAKVAMAAVAKDIFDMWVVLHGLKFGVAKARGALAVSERDAFGE